MRCLATNCLAALVVAVSAFALTGCSAIAEDESDTNQSSLADRTRDQNELRAQCMRADGWDVEADPVSLGIRFACANDAECTALRAALVICENEFPPIFERASFTIQQAESYYVALMAAGQCLRDEGFPISEPPSRQSIVDAVMNSDLVPWDPWGEILHLQDPQFSFLQAVDICPAPSLMDFAS